MYHICLIYVFGSYGGILRVFVQDRLPLADTLQQKGARLRWIPGHREEAQATSPAEKEDTRRNNEVDGLTLAKKRCCDCEWSRVREPVGMEGDLSVLVGSTVHHYPLYLPLSLALLVALSPHLFLSSFSLVPPFLPPTCWTTEDHFVGVPGKYQVHVPVQVRGRGPRKQNMWHFFHQYCMW